MKYTLHTEYVEHKELIIGTVERSIVMINFFKKNSEYWNEVDKYCTFIETGKNIFIRH